MLKPNILFIIADDASHFGGYGRDWVRTPNIDRLAADGVLFEQAFTTNPKCAPSRASILTGRETWQLEDACNHWNIFPSKFECFPDTLESVGYHVGFTGKGWAPGDWKAGGRRRNPAGTGYNQRTLVPPENTSLAKNDYLANFEDFLADRKEGAPFYFWFGAKEPHRPYELGQGKRAGKRREEISAIPPYWPEDDIVRGDMLDYAFEIEYFDQQVGRFVNLLKENGEYDNTLIVVTSDNGAPFPRVKGQMYDDDFRLPLVMRWGELGKGGRRENALVSFVDFAATFLDVAGVDIDGRELAGESLLGLLEGESSTHREFVAMGRERHDLGREGDLGFPVRCLRNDEFLYVKNYEPERWPAGNPETGFTNCDSSPTKDLVLDLEKNGVSKYYDLAFGKRPAEELYSIKKDPHCMINLAGTAEYKGQLCSMREALNHYLERTGDPRVRGEGDIFESYPYCGGKSHSWEAYLEGTWEKQDY
ncbi:sulfatase family protein [Pelagicoccus mobilis]|uniref:Sulfatase n=1 Tax=Pelagicoccus mobilis TaxID=415221 RepID=A0A934S3L6_9BACT|nr:sulfatase [Pelagicoccus mobilis]MBK1880469.1 sulfatase [Pelagicoccus mobilis]